MQVTKHDIDSFDLILLAKIKKLRKGSCSFEERRESNCSSSNLLESLEFEGEPKSVLNRIQEKEMQFSSTLHLG